MLSVIRCHHWLHSMLPGFPCTLAGLFKIKCSARRYFGAVPAITKQEFLLYTAEAPILSFMQFICRRHLLW